MEKRCRTFFRRVRSRSDAELLDKCINQDVWVLMKGDSEVEGTLRGFDEFYSM